MNAKRTTTTVFALASLMLCAMSQSGVSQEVVANLSTREAYVGMPVVLQLSVNNASDYEEPAVPEIDGCDVRMTGTPSQSSQVMIINGRRSETHSITMQYTITPRRAGTFDIPPMNVKVDGKTQRTQPLRFVATKSETGDLLFVEIDGGKDKVFVGEPLDLTLKIWVKPFRDKATNITLSEANMWQMIAEQTSWGSFSDRLRELAENNQRPGGQEVLRDDGTGTERAYYLYEINATVYPKRPGKIDADDVQIVVNYPTSLGKSRDPFADFFEDSPFGGSSPISRMMKDDFFSSPFGNRLTVSSVRPIVGSATVDATEVVPVPTAGRPADYRGAVGRYKIMTQATPNAVNAGDPITLNVGITGTGPMELVQAPPLSELPSLTSEFKIADQTLAGFVQGDAKVFSTTIRPRIEGVAQIPPIPFSFFDPDREKFETVMSEPISITVNKAESLSLDAIVGKIHSSNGSGESGQVAESGLKPNFTNSDSANLLVTQQTPRSSNWWWIFVIVPPIVLLASVLVRNWSAVLNRLPSLRSAASRCRLSIDRATESVGIVNAMTRYISRRTRQVCDDSSSAIGALRSNGLYQIASEVESMFQKIERLGYGDESSELLSSNRQSALAMVDQLESAFGARKNSMVRRMKTRKPFQTTATRASILLFAFLIGTGSNCGFASDNTTAETANQVRNQVATVNEPSANVNNENPVQLSESQARAILAEASEVYRHAQSVSETDAADARDSFALAVEKYQLLVDSGIRNSALYLNLGNACLQNGLTGRAIVNFERAHKLDPDNQTIATNLEFANTLVKNAEPVSTSGNGNAAANVTSLQSVIHRLRTWNDTFIGAVGLRTVRWTLVLSSLLFWGMLIARANGYRFPHWKMAAVPMLILAISLVSEGLWETQSKNQVNGVVVADNVLLHSGDGEQFDEVFSMDDAQGHLVEILANRGNWTQIRTAHGHIGWVGAKGVEQL